MTAATERLGHAARHAAAAYEERWRDETTGSVDVEATSSDEYADAIRELTLMHACEAWALRLFGPAAIDSELQRLASEL